MSTVILNPFIGTPTSVTMTGGIYQELRFSALVTGLTQTDNSILSAAIAAATAAHAELTPGGASTNYPGLYCSGIDARVYEDVGKVMIDYTFIRASGGFITYFGSGYHDSGALFTYDGGTSLTQFETPRDAYGNNIVVQHTWDGTEIEPGVTGVTDAICQPISVQTPLTVVTARGYLQLSYPDIVSKAWTGYVNSDIWAGEPPGTWMVTNVTWSPVDTDATPYVFEFSFTFENNWQGYQPLAWFNNPRTGNPPWNVVPGLGIKRITWYPAREFFPYFPV